MAVSEAQKRASAKYQSKTMASLACRVKKDEAEKFKEYCNHVGKTTNACLHDFVMDCINQLELLSTPT